MIQAGAATRIRESIYVPGTPFRCVDKQALASHQRHGGVHSHLVCFCRPAAARSACCAHWLLPGSRNTHPPQFVHGLQYTALPLASLAGLAAAFTPATMMRWAAGPRPGCRAVETAAGACRRRLGTRRRPSAQRAPQRDAASGPCPSPGTSWCRSVRQAPHHRALATVLSSRKRRRRAWLHWQSA